MELTLNQILDTDCVKRFHFIKQSTHGLYSLSHCNGLQLNYLSGIELIYSCFPFIIELLYFNLV